MNEGVPIMGDSEDEIPREVYEALAKEWAAEIDKHNVFELLGLDKSHLRRGIMDKAEKLGLDETEEDKLIVAVEALKAAVEGQGVKKGLLPDDVSVRHVDDRPVQTKYVVQEIAQKTLGEVKNRNPGSRTR